MSIVLADSTISGVHWQLSLLAGTWEGTTKTWFDSSKLEDESPINGTSYTGRTFYLALV